jgi:hypothetical protein
MTRVEILQRCEDSNEFMAGELGIDPIPNVTIGHKAKKFSVVRVDKFPAGWIGELPPQQADNLMRLGLAKSA